jgi:hypothetical protein
MSEPSNETWAALLAHHRDVLTERAVTAEVAAERGYLSASDKAQLARYGFKNKGHLPPALVIPIHAPTGERVEHVLRADAPRLDKKGKTRKYEWPWGHSLRLDVPKRCQSAVRDPAVTLWVTEGALKADSLAAAGAGCVVGLNGTYGWRDPNGVLADWEYFALKGRRVRLTFDSDAMSKREVHTALGRFYALLASRGARPEVVYLPGGVDGAKVGVDDFLAAGHTLPDLEALAEPQLRPFTPYPRDNGATVQPLPVEPPPLAFEQDILARFKQDVRLRGVVGEETTAATVYLAISSRLLDQPVSLAVKGHTSSGKSFTVERTVEFFPPSAVLVFTAMSQRALVYSSEDYRHRTLVLYEVVALREGVEDDLTSYFVRSLLSEGRIEYPVTVRGPDGNWTTRTITKQGPTNMLLTTTKTHIHRENETRLLSLTTDDSREQTKRVMKALAEPSGQTVNLDEWQTLQTWLDSAEHRVTIPYASQLAENIPPIAVRLRRDFKALLALIQTHAILHQLNRKRDEQGRIIATVDDYAAVRDLVADVIAEGVGSTVSDIVRETVAAVAALTAGTDGADDDERGASARRIGERLDLDKSTVSRRIRTAADDGYLRNLEQRRGRPGRWVIGDPLPEEMALLPQPHNLTADESAGPEGGCTVAPDSEGERHNSEERDAARIPQGFSLLAEPAECRECGVLSDVEDHRGPVHPDCADELLVFADPIGPCDLCGQLCRSTLHGDPLHPNCAVSTGSTLDDEHDTLSRIANTFAGVERVDNVPVDEWEYVGKVVGPCRVCGAPCRSTFRGQPAHHHCVERAR